VKGIAGVDLQALAQRLTGAEAERTGDGTPTFPEVAAHAVDPAAPTKAVPTPKAPDGEA